MEPITGGRRKITNIELDHIKGGSLKNSLIYIGRGNKKLGIPRSKWANPFVTGTHGFRLNNVTYDALKNAR